ncbi:MAG: divalent metal cation transporter [Flavobacteriales bacterium]|nr:divalent metal cation transporter [Flavobacteriales bacterium]MCB9448139.1 divalent metal cation transporter [Flavobacteriales bacterium]
MKPNVSNFLKTLGPGLIFASTAIGVSHLVQSTRAGANYGYGLLWAVCLANLCKYPFFEFGSRYANATGKSLIDGYKRLHTGMLWLYFLITLGSMFFVSAAVGAVTAGFLDNLFGVSQMISNGTMITTIVLFASCIGILLIGKFNALDGLMKVIGVVMLLSTLGAFFLSLHKGPAAELSWFLPPSEWQGTDIAFIIALMGWMPTAVDMSTWNSLWTIERIRETGYKPKLKETLLDFNLGYIVTSLLAICFVTLGAYMIFGSGKVMPESSGAFANAVVTLYTQTMGNWTYVIIAASAFSIMFGTSIAVFDGYARSIERTTELLFLSGDKANDSNLHKKFYSGSLLVVGLGSLLIIVLFGKSMKQLVDFATTMSFLIAPVIAIANHILVTKKYISEEAVPPLWLRTLSWLGILFLLAFSVYFLVNRGGS